MNPIQTHWKDRRRGVARLLCALPLLLGTAVAQDGPTPEEKNDDGTWPVIETGPQQIGPSNEMEALFKKVETRLLEIDRLLSDASAGDTSSLKEVGESGMAELLKSTGASSRQVVEDIDRILELAAQNGGT